MSETPLTCSGGHAALLRLPPRAAGKSEQLLQPAALHVADRTRTLRSRQQWVRLRPCLQCFAKPDEPWNKGKLIGRKPPLRRKQVWLIRTRLQMEGRTRDLAPFTLAIDSKLRGCARQQLTCQCPQNSSTVSSRAMTMLPAERPQSTGRTAPVIAAAASEARNPAARATSTGSAMRPSGYQR